MKKKAAKQPNNLKGKTILLIISGGIAAYKALELIRLIRKDGAIIRCILTKGGAEFVTALSIGALTEQPVYTDLWSLKDETEMGHIRLSREADAIVIAPASANMIAKMANGLADDLASTALLAADKPILIAPAMNHRMWHHPATQHNLKLLAQRGVKQVGPFEGDMACGEYGMGRMAEPEQTLAALKQFFFDQPFKGLKALVTSGPTFEPIDPVRFIGNHSSGLQGHAIAAALAHAGADVTLISGPVAIPDPPGVKTIHVQTAEEMLNASLKALPADIAICAAAVSDWRAAKPLARKMKKREGAEPPALTLTENPDILKTICAHKKRPKLVIGFAAETENLLENARAKRKRKGCDWIIANEVGNAKVFGKDENTVHLITAKTHEAWPKMRKEDVAEKLILRMKDFFKL